MFRIILRLTARGHQFLQQWAPTNRVVAFIRTRPGHKWGPVAMLLALPYLAIAAWCTTIVDQGGPGWLNFFVLLGCWNTLKMAWLGPISLIWLTHAKVQERAKQHGRKSPRAQLEDVT